MPGQCYVAFSFCSTSKSEAPLPVCSGVRNRPPSLFMAHLDCRAADGAQPPPKWEPSVRLGTCSKQTFLGQPTNACLIPLFSQSFFAKVGRPLWRTLLRFQNDTSTRVKSRQLRTNCNMRFNSFHSRHLPCGQAGIAYEISIVCTQQAGEGGRLFRAALHAALPIAIHAL